MPEPPTQFVAMQVSRLNDGHVGGRPSGGRSRLEIVRSSIAITVSPQPSAGGPDASEAPEQVPPDLAAELVDRIRRQMAPQGLEKTESAPGKGRVSEVSNLQDLASALARG